MQTKLNLVTKHTKVKEENKAGKYYPQPVNYIITADTRSFSIM